MRSARFTIPPRLSFYLCGHLGPPQQPPREENFVVLRLAESGQEIVRAHPPRNDVARQVLWDLSEYAGQQGYLELVDGLALPSYAWLAVSRFEPAVVELPSVGFAQRGLQQASACALVAALQLTELKGLAAQVLNDAGSSWATRAAAAQAVLAFDSRPLLTALASLLAEPALNEQLRERIRAAIVATSSDADSQSLAEIMKAVPTRVQRQLADSLAATPVGAATVVQLIEQGHVTPRLLQDPAIKQKLGSSGGEQLSERLERLLAELPPLNVELLKLIEQRRTSFAPAAADVARGQELFRRHCANCHQVAGQGALVAPQLDGIGNRGLERVLEDVLDPNRNIDAAFHLSIIVRNNGQVTTGLLRREEGSSLVLADQQGKEFTVLKSEVEEHRRASVSLMPANFGELLQPDEFNDLLRYLLSLKEEREK